MKIYDVQVNGTDVDAQTRCAHYKSDVDIIAIKFKCCGEWFPCFSCHAETVSHEARVWSKNEFDEKAILCGNCGYQLMIAEYLKCASICPQCSASYNPDCANHYQLYFEFDSKK